MSSAVPRNILTLCFALLVGVAFVSGCDTPPEPETAETVEQQPMVDPEVPTAEDAPVLDEPPRLPPPSASGTEPGEAQRDAAGDTEVADMAQSDRPQGAREPAQTDDEPQSEQAAVKTPAELDAELPARESLEGMWVFSVSSFGSIMQGMLLEIDEQDGTLTPEILETSPYMPDWTLKSSQIDGNEIEMVFGNSQDVDVTFRGQLIEGEVRGNIAFQDAGIQLAMMRASQRENLDDISGPVPAEGAQALQQRLQAHPSPTQQDLAEAIYNVSQEHPDSPLTVDLYQRLMQLIPSVEMPREQVMEAVESFEQAAKPWGERVEGRAHYAIALMMAESGYDSQEVAEQIQATESAFDGNIPQAYSDSLQMAKGVALLKSEDESQSQEGLSILEEMLPESPFNAELRTMLAEHLQEAGKTEKALELYATAAVIPGAGASPEPARELWMETHDSEEGFQEFLNKTYEENIHAFAAAPDSVEIPQSQRTVLAELFTGAMCPPCVAADVATGALEKTFPQDALIVIRYHQHIPGPDPLTTTAGMERFDYYNGSGTPTLTIDGNNIQVAGMYGGAANAPTGYEELKEIVLQSIGDAPQAAITASAEAQDGVMQLSVETSELPETVENLRLRVCLVEKLVAFPARNGIRLHEMVVRSMPTGAEGVAPQDGKLSYKEEINLADWAQSVRDQVEMFNAQFGGQMGSGPELGTELELVAFVQNDETQEILQATAVPVKGEISYPEPGQSDGEQGGGDDSPDAANASPDEETAEVEDLDQ